LISIGQSSDSTLFRITNKLDSIPNGVAISLAIIKEDSIRFIGLEKSNGKLNQIELKDSLFEIGSLTKVFTFTRLCIQEKRRLFVVGQVFYWKNF